MSSYEAPVKVKDIDYRYGTDDDGMDIVDGATVRFEFNPLGISKLEYRERSTPQLGAGLLLPYEHVWVDLTSLQASVDLSDADNPYDDAEGLARSKLAKEWRALSDECEFNVRGVSPSDNKESWHVRVAFDDPSKADQRLRMTVKIRSSSKRPVAQPSDAIKQAIPELRAMLRKFSDEIQGTALLTHQPEEPQ